MGGLKDKGTRVEEEGKEGDTKGIWGAIWKDTMVKVSLNIYKYEKI